MSITFGQGITVGSGVTVTGFVPVEHNLVEYLDARDYLGSGSSWPARVGTNATLHGATTPSWSGNYFTFDPNALQYADTPWLGNYSNWSAEAWFHLDGPLSSTAATAVLTTVYDDGNGNNYGHINYCLGNNSVSPGNPNIQAGYFDSSGPGWQETAGYTPTVGNWYQMVGTYDGVNIKLYVNGALVYTAPSDATATANGGPTRIARRWDGTDGDNTNFFPGKVGVVRIYSAVLNDAEVLQNFNADRGTYGL